MKILKYLPFLAAIALTQTSWSATQVINAKASDLNGAVHELGMEDGKAQSTALIFLDPICPISRRYLPHLIEDIAPFATKHGVGFYGIISNPGTSLTESKNFAATYEIPFPILFDASGDLATRLRPTHMPEAFVINKEGSLLYRGWINDRFSAVGKRRAHVNSHDLMDAIKAVASGERPRLARTEPVGCLFEEWPDIESMEAGITYSRDIAPILDAHCVECHRVDGVAPFPLQNYAQARRKAKMSSYVVEDRIMPPWKADRTAGNPHFRNERVLTERQIALIRAWAENGAPEGDPLDRLPAPKFDDDGWRSGKPDLVVTMPEPFEVPADGPDIYRYFVIPCPPGLEEDRVLTGIDFKPGDPSVVHHSDYFIDYSGNARKQTSTDGQPGFSISGTGGFLSYFDAGFLGAWAPGSEPYRLSNGQGMAIQGGGDIVIEIHYHPTGKKSSDQSSLAFYFAKEPVSEYVSGLYIGTQDVDIPAHADDYWREIWMDVPADIRILDIGPHMHYIGKESHIEAVLPDGSKLPLLSISDWDLNWQTGYYYREPVFLPKGSRIYARFRYDNTRNNPANPHSPPRRIQWGWGTEEEMCEVYLTIIPENESDWPAIQEAMMATWIRPANPQQARLAATPVNPGQDALRLTRLSLYEEAGESLLTHIATSEHYNAVVNELRRILKQDPQNKAGQVALGSLIALSALNPETSFWKQYQSFADAEGAFNRALKTDPNYWDARMAKCELYAHSEDKQLAHKAIRMLEQLIAAQAETGEPLPKHQRPVQLLEELRAKYPSH